MTPKGSTSFGTSLSRGAVAGIAGTVVMTVFQKLVEMPITGRGDSFAPADFAARVLPIEAKDEHQRRQLNWVTHFALGAMWGSAFAIADRAGLRGQKAVATVFGAVYTGDVLLNTALGLYEPTKWSAGELGVDLVDKLVQAEATGMIFDRMQEL